jgi:hypothetical protein
MVSGWVSVPLRLGFMAPESVTRIPPCVECGAVWLSADGDRWKAYLADDEPPELAFYCPSCAEREFKSD